MNIILIKQNETRDASIEKRQAQCEKKCVELGMCFTRLLYHLRGFLSTHYDRISSLLVDAEGRPLIDSSPYLMENVKLLTFHFFVF